MTPDLRLTAENRAAVNAELIGFANDERRRLSEAFAAEPVGMAYCVDHAEVFDHLLAVMFDLATKWVADKLGPIPTEADLCVAAVGGYGRRALNPWSDIDVVFIPKSEEHPFIDAAVREMLVLFKDVFDAGGLPHVAHSYRPLSDLGLIDHQTATALLESRPLAGDQSLHIHFLQELMLAIPAVEFVNENVGERRRVWHDPQASLFAVEPDLKSGPGGLRDFHAAVWIAKVVYRIHSWDVLDELQRRGVVKAQERGEVVEALEFIQRCRNWLHLQRGQKLDELLVQYQQPMAEALGYTDAGEVAASEELMRDYYAAARAIAKFSRRMLHLSRAQRIDFVDGLYVENWTLYPSHESIFREAPSRLVQVFRHSQRFDLRLSPELERLITENAGELDPKVRRRASVGANFLAMLADCTRVPELIRTMLSTGVLEQLLPEFAPLLSLLPTDPAHKYTVGEHSLKVLETIYTLRDRPREQDEKVLSDLIRGLLSPEVLGLAALFHDVGKLDGTGKHSQTGVPVAKAVARRLGLQESDVDRLAFLVREHLTMMHTARLRALAMPDTIEAFCQILPETESLDALAMLTVLTHADTRSVADGVLRPPDRVLLMELFEKTAKRLSEAGAEYDAEQQRRRAKRVLRRAPALRDIDPEQVAAHLDRLPTWYAVNTPPALIAKHMDYVSRLEDGENPVIEMYKPLGARHTELTVCTFDRPGVLRDVAGAVTANNLDIYLAQLDVCDAPPGQPLPSISTTWVDDFGQPLGQVKQERLREDLTSILSGHETAAGVLERRRKVVPEQLVMHFVEVSCEASKNHTVLTFRAADQRGLLYRLTEAMAAEELSILVAKVTTWRGAAEDAFYVVAHETGEKLARDEAAALGQRLARRLSTETTEVRVV